MYDDIKKYLTAYFSILMESKLNDVISSNNMINKPLSEKDFENLLKTMDIINSNNDNVKTLCNFKTITESVNFFNDILNIILKSKNGEIIRKDKILKNINRKWHLFKKFSNLVKTFYVFKCSFTNFNEIKKIFKTYSYVDDEILNFYTKKFIKESGNNNGVYFHTNDFKAICLNTKKNIDYSLIIHEFTHYLQDVLNYDLIKLKKNFIFDEDQIKFLNLNDSELEILKENFSSNEIMPCINEFIETCDKVFNLFKYFCLFYINIIKNESLYEIFKGWFYPIFSIEHLNEQWKQTLSEIEDWKTAFKEIKKSKMMYRFQLIDFVNNAVFRKFYKKLNKQIYIF